jgi:hypothetical protein
LSAGEAVAVVGEQDFAECVSDALTEASPTTRVISEEELRSQLFPWFEPATAPRSAQGFRTLLERRLVSEKLGELGVRYIVDVRGSSQERPDRLVIGTPPWALGARWAERDASLRASVWDVKSAELAGELHASASGTFVIGAVSIVPVYFNPAPTESMVCENIGSELAKFLGNGPSQEK